MLLDLPTTSDMRSVSLLSQLDNKMSVKMLVKTPPADVRNKSVGRRIVVMRPDRKADS